MTAMRLLYVLVIFSEVLCECEREPEKWKQKFYQATGKASSGFGRYDHLRVPINRGENERKAFPVA
jgi:hypothetical protein